MTSGHVRMSVPLSHWGLKGRGNRRAKQALQSVHGAGISGWGLPPGFPVLELCTPGPQAPCSVSTQGTRLGLGQVLLLAHL